MFNTFWMAGAIALITLLFTGANYYTITRRIAIFGGQINSKLIILFISLLITLIVVGLQTATFANTKFFSILGSIGSRMFMLIPIVAILMGIEHLISTFLFFTPLSGGEGGGRTETKWKWGRRKRGLPTLSVFLLILAYGVYNALTTKITETTITTDKIPNDVNIMLVADLHVDDLLYHVHLKALKKQIELQQPDFVLIAGDFFNRANVRQAEAYKILSDIHIPMYAVEGNHDTMGSLEALDYIQQHTPIQFLYNQSLTLPEENIQLIGIEEKGQRQKDGMNKAVWTVTLQTGQGKWLHEVLEASNIQSWPTFNILMTHQPISLSKLSDFPIDLEVAGHTHRGQIRGLSYIVALVNDYGYGKYEEDGRTAFVTQGIGTRGLPFRIGTRSEIVMLHLVKEVK